MEAKALAEEQKRLNPDCWKRKRTNSVRPPPAILFLSYYIQMTTKNELTQKYGVEPPENTWQSVSWKGCYATTIDK